MNSEEAIRLGAWLAERRNRRGRTQLDVAAAAGVSDGFISDLENGKKSGIRPKTLAKIVQDGLGADPLEAFAAAGWIEGIDPESVAVARSVSSLPPELRRFVLAALREALDAHSEGKAE